MPNILIETRGTLEVKDLIQCPVSAIPILQMEKLRHGEGSFAQGHSASQWKSRPQAQVQDSHPTPFCDLLSVGFWQGLPVRGGHKVGWQAVGQLVAIKLNLDEVLGQCELLLIQHAIAVTVSQLPDLA